MARGGRQLRLMNGPDEARGDIVTWKLDPVTRRRGLAGVERAREALAATHPPEQRLRRAS